MAWVAITLLAGAVLTSLAVSHRTRENEAFVRSRLEAQARELADDIVGRFALYEYGLRGARGVLQSGNGGEIDPRAFRRHIESRALEREFPGARGFGFVRRVATDGMDRELARLKARGITLRTFGDHGGERFVVELIEPIERNQGVLGLDIASEPRRMNAALAAARSGRATMTGPVTIPQASEAQSRSFLVLLPMYRDGAMPDTREQRESATVGWTYVPLVTDEVLEGLSLHQEHLALTLTDITEPELAEAFYSTTSLGEPVSRDAPEAALLRVPYGRSWVIRVQARPSFAGQFDLQPASAAGWTGALVTLLLAALQAVALALRQRRRHAVVLQARLATIIDNASEAIVGQDNGGRVVLWNAAAERLLGWSRDEAMGRSVRDLLLPPDRAIEDRDLADRLNRGDRVRPFDSTLLRRDGTLADVAITPSPITDPSGQVVGLARLINDIGDRKAQEQHLLDLNAGLEARVRERTSTLEDVEHFLRTVLDAVPSMISYWDRDVVNRAANRATLAWRMPDGGTIEGRRMREVVGSTVYAQLKPHVRAVLQGEPQSFEVSMPSPATGERRELAVRYLPDEREGAVQGFYAVLDDVTELNRHRRALETTLAQQAAERARLDSIVQGTNAGTWEWNVQTGEVRFNERWAALLGHDYDELRPSGVQAWIDLVNADDLQRSGILLQRHFSGETDFYECELRMRHANGQWVWLLDRGQVRSHCADGRPEWMYGTTQDIGATKLIEQRLRDSEAFLERVSQVAGVGGWQFEVATRQLSWTRQTRRISEVPDSYEPEITSALGFYPPEARPLVLAAFNAAIEQGRPFDIEVPCVTARGRRRWVRAVGEPVHDETNPLGKPVRVVGAFQDITERHDAEVALREAKRAAEAASHSKSAFLANMSHEIRTPLNAVLGVAHLLADTPLDDDQRALLGKARVAGRSLLGIVNDVLDLAKIEAGEMTLADEVFSLPDLLREIESVYAVQAVARGLTLTVHCDARVPAALTGDADRLRQALVNLVGNAIKFTPSGSVAIAATVLGGGDGPQLRLSVRDSGIGVAPEVQARLFQPFTQADETTTRRFGGTGLGLSIVRRLVELMQGEVGLISAPGRGSEFWLRVPLRTADPTTLPPPPAPLPQAQALDTARVLLVDDSDINLEIAQRMLERHGVRVHTCHDGEQALKALMAGTDAFDLVLMDVQMPVMDGLEATRRLRRVPGLERLPVIALTAGALAIERQRALDAGCSDFLTKPIDPDALVAALVRALPRGVDLGPGHASAPPADPAWPEVAGVDARRAMRQLGGDAELFRRSLARLLGEHAEWMALSPAASPAWSVDERKAWRARAHRLRGAAGMLAIGALSDAAKALETSLGPDGSDDETLSALHAVREAFDRLHHAAQCVQTAAAIRPPRPPADPTRQRALEARLAQQLATQDLSALESFDACRAGLEDRLGANEVLAIGRAIELLDFASALALLAPGDLTEAQSPAGA